MKDLTPFMTWKELLKFIGVFLVMLAAAKLGQYLYFEWDTSPAVLWPPTGLALAIMYLWGYRYAIPTFLALAAASVTGPVSHVVPALVTTPLGQVLGNMAGVYLLHRFSFGGTFSTMRNTFVFLLVIVAVCMIAPTISTVISFLTGNLTTTAVISWSRSWAGYMFSSLIIFPFVVSWLRPEKRGPTRSPLEIGFVALTALVSVYLLFWTPLAENYFFYFFALFFVAHFWIGFRFSTRILTLSIFVSTTIGIFGLFLSPHPTESLTNQLFASEILLLLVVPVFFGFSALVKERANTIGELREAMMRIEKENVVKNEFIAVLAHELRNPLAPVKTTLEILSLQDLDADTNTLIRSALQQVYAMRRLLDDLLDITRVTQGKFQLQIEEVPLCSIIEQSAASASHLFKERGHTLILDQWCDHSIIIQADPVRAEQVLVNILNNAAKYTDPGGTIELLHEVKGDTIEVKVTDNGRGIAEENLENIFKPFWQVRSAGPQTAGGIGVGLSLTRYIVELHGGKIYAESKGVGHGSVFTIVLPLVTAKQGREKGKPTVAVTQSDRMRPFRILIVDDNEVAAHSLSKLLSLKGHTVGAVYEGRGVRDAVKEFKPEIVFLDIGMPDMSGYEVAKVLRSVGYAGKIVALTGYGQKEDRDAAYAAGFDHHITKPAGIARLEEYLSSVS